MDHWVAPTQTQTRVKATKKHQHCEAFSLILNFASSSENGVGLFGLSHVAYLKVHILIQLLQSEKNLSPTICLMILSSATHTHKKKKKLSNRSCMCQV